MGEITPINPRVIFVNETEPSDKTEGKLWYNTINNSLYTSNGSAYVILEMNLDDLNKQQLQQDLNILINSVASSSTLNDYEDMFVDIFSDATGTDNTINTTDTTAVFDTNKYVYQSFEESADLSKGIAQTTDDGLETVFNTNYTADENIIISEIILENNASQQNNVVINVKIGSDVIATDTFNFYANQTKTVSFELSDYTKIIPKDTIFTIEVLNGNFYCKTGTTFDAGDYMTIEEGTQTIPGSSGVEVSMTAMKLGWDSSKPKLIIKTNAQTIEENPIAHQIYSDNSTTENGTINYDISFDNGINWVTDQSLNTKNASVHEGENMIIKLNLNGTSIDDKIEAKNYGVMLFY